MRAYLLLILAVISCPAIADTVTVEQEITRKTTRLVTRVTQETEDGQVVEQVINGEVMPNGSVRRIAIDNNTGLPYYYYIHPSPMAGYDPGTLKVYVNGYKDKL
jgi:hypothetical protein